HYPMAGKEEPAWKQSKMPYAGPYPLFNTTLNLVAGTELAYQDRKGESFVFTPDYSRSKATGYARFDPPAETSARAIEAFRNLSLGRAVTISGAAVDPNMRNYQSGGLTALLTVLNLRLGWWIENPSPRPQEARRAQLPWRWMPFRKRWASGWTACTPDSAAY